MDRKKSDFEDRFFYLHQTEMKDSFCCTSFLFSLPLNTLMRKSYQSIDIRRNYSYTNSLNKELLQCKFLLRRVSKFACFEDV